MTASEAREILSVGLNATPDEIRAAYRRLSKSTHPDMQGSAALFRQVKDAFEILIRAPNAPRCPLCDEPLTADHIRNADSECAGVRRKQAARPERHDYSDTQHREPSQQADRLKPRPLSRRAMSAVWISMACLTLLLSSLDREHKVDTGPLFVLPRWQQEEGSASCGDYTIVRTPKSTGRGIKVVARDGTVEREFALDDEARRSPSFGYFDAAWCKDVTGDGVPELMIEQYTGGAHCCSEGTLLSLGKTVSLTAEIHGGHFGVPEPRKLDAWHATYQLVGANDALADFEAGPKDFVPFVYTSPFPRVLDYRGGYFVEATKDYPDLLRSDRQAACGSASKAENEASLKGLGLRMLADSLLLEDWPSVQSELGLPARLVTWLDEQEVKVRSAIASLGGDADSRRSSSPTFGLR
jgi:hypothetical protein